MKRTKRLGRHTFIAISFVVFTAAALALPALFGNFDRQAVIRGVAVLASGSDRFSLSEPVEILSTPGVTLESGTIFLPTSEQSTSPNTAARKGELLSGSTRLAIEGGVIRVDLANALTVGDTALDFSRRGLKNDPSTTKGGPPSSNDILAPLVEALMHHHFNALALRDCTIIVASRNGPGYRLNDVQLDITVDKSASVIAAGSFRFRGQTLGVKSTVGLAHIDKDPTRFPIRIAIDGRLLEARINGQFIVGERPQITAHRAQLKIGKFGAGMRWLGLKWPYDFEPGAFTAIGALDWTGHAIAFQAATFELGDNRAKGTLSMSYRGERPLVEGTLAAGKLDFSRYFSADPPATAAAFMEPARWLQRLGVRADAGMTPVLRGVDADLRVSAASVSGTGFEIGNSAATVSLRAGKLLADLAEFEMPSGGTGDIQFSLDVNGDAPKIGVRGRMHAIEVGHATTLAFGGPILSGRGNLSLDVHGEGNSHFEFLETLNGKVSLTAPDASELALDVLKLVSRKRSGTAVPGWGAALPGRTALRDVNAQLLFVDGVAHTRGVSGVTGKSVVSVRGQIEPSARAIDLMISVGEYVPGAAPGEPKGVGPGQAVLHASGHWAKPTVVSPEHAFGASAP